METKKHIQREETRYWNNEFENMPSIDFRYEDLTSKTQKRIDWEVVKNICDRYGFRYTIIESTFGSDTSDFVLYYKTDITNEKYNELRNAYRNENTQENWDRFYNMNERHYDIFRKLHECVHELDEYTDLKFECCWCGNCGLFGSDDVRKVSYSGGSGLVTWEAIKDRWSPLIHDTFSKLSKGVYAMMYTHYIKPEIQDSPMLEDFEPKLLEMVRSIIGNDLKADFEVGKRQCDSDGYKALVIRYKERNEYRSMITFSREWTGRYHITSARPLCGQSSWVMDWKNPLDDLKAAVL